MRLGLLSLLQEIEAYHRVTEARHLPQVGLLTKDWVAGRGYDLEACSQTYDQ